MSTAIPSPMPAATPLPPLHRNPLHVSILTPAAWFFAAALLGGSAGCFHGNEDELTSAVVSGEKPISMEGVSPFFDGRISVKVTVARGIGQGLKGGGKPSRNGGNGTADTRQAFADSSERSFVGSPIPPVTLHLILTNTGPVPVKVTLIDFASDLGNFAIEPDTLMLAPGQTGEPTAMVSQLGVTSESIPFKVTLKLEGKKESKSVAVVIIAPPPPPAKS